MGTIMDLKASRIFLLFLLIFLKDDHGASTSSFVGECTIGVFSGRVTSDGRPILWKNRDVTNAVQKFCFFRPQVMGGETTLAFVANAYSNDTTRVYMGLNAAGFGVMNSNTYNLNDDMNNGIDDGAIMQMALQSCRRLSDFEKILDVTSVAGRKDCWNFGAIDAFGDGAIYECSNRSYVKYDVNDSLMEGDGLVLRATFSFSGGDSLDGFARYKRAQYLVKKRLGEEPIDAGFVLQTLARDLANPLADPYPLPYDGSQNGRPAGFILARNVTINRDISRSVIVIRGVTPGEDPALATIYAMIGPAVLSVAFPMWVGSECVPPMLHDGSEVAMYAEVMRRRPVLYSLQGDDAYLNSRYLVGKHGVGLYTFTLPLENGMLSSVEDYLSDWRHEPPGREVFANVQNALAETIFAGYRQIPLRFDGEMAQEGDEGATIANFPNPFNNSTTISLSGFGGNESVALSIYNITGQKIRDFESPAGSARIVTWDGRDGFGNAVASGVYFASAVGKSRSLTTKMILMK